VNAQGGIGFGIKRELFFLNLEDGYFGCQVNESTAVLQLYELSRLCDGKQDCYKGSDELRRELKCTGEYAVVDVSRFCFLRGGFQNSTMAWAAPAGENWCSIIGVYVTPKFDGTVQ